MLVFEIKCIFILGVLFWKQLVLSYENIILIFSHYKSDAYIIEKIRSHDDYDILVGVDICKTILIFEFRFLTNYKVNRHQK